MARIRWNDEKLESLRLEWNAGGTAVTIAPIFGYSAKTIQNGVAKLRKRGANLRGPLRRPGGHIDVEALRGMKRHGMSIRGMARAANCSHNTVRRKLGLYDSGKPPRAPVTTVACALHLADLIRVYGHPRERPKTA